MKNTFLVIVILAFSTLNAQNIDEAWVKENYTKKEVQIEMRDGIKLFTAIFSPKNTKEKAPILMVRTPYSCGPYGENAYTARLWYSYWKNYLREGYVLVIQDVRGRWMSEGEFMDVRPFIENKKTKKDVD